MTIDVAVTHRTRYRFDRPVTLGPHVVRLRPAPHCRTPVRSYSLEVGPADHFVNWQQDPFGNWLARLVFNEPATELFLDVELVADMTVVNPFDFFLEEAAERWPFTYDARTSHDLAPYLTTVGPGDAGPAFERFLAAVSRRPRRTVDFLAELNRQVTDEVAYTVRMEPGVQTPEATLTKAMGSCRDSGWLLVQLLRRLGVAARFVSGYLVQLTADEAALDGPSGPAADFTDLHAWAEAYLPGAGWVGLDPTSGLFAGEGHLPLAATPEPSTAAPVTGATSPAEVELEFSNTVRRVHEDPRVTLPYDDAQWEAILALGDAVDAELEAGDVRLTMGGEPTFVSIDDRESAEWKTAADGPAKRARAADLARRLRDAFAPGGVAHHAAGKWYPGEPLPRWEIDLLWRADGEPTWADPDLVADPYAPAAEPAGGAEAERLVRALAAELGVGVDRALPAFEDPLHVLLQDAQQPLAPGRGGPLSSRFSPPADPSDPVGATEGDLLALAQDDLDDDPAPAGPVAPDRSDEPTTVTQVEGVPDHDRDHVEADIDPGDPDDRERLAGAPGPGEAGDPLPAGSARAALAALLPDDPVMTTAPGRRALIDAMGGHRGPPRGWVLPLERSYDAGPGTVAWASGPWWFRRGWCFLVPGDSPVGLRLPLASRPWSVPAAADVRRGDHPSPRQALCVEPRDGHLFVFLPPTDDAESWLDLVGRVERAAARLGLPVALEGYAPPPVPELRRLAVTPDPGVIEVNVQPAANWSEQVAVTTTVHEQARLARLGTETFDLDGYHTGTGGGNHLTLGGPTPMDSPLLRRPDLLRSLLTYWQHHPSLSYLFSGRFVGPTSQAPRVDEARHDALYELETAFGQFDELFGADGQPQASQLWLVDRALRHLLVDVTGNTHRAEFCIDKLYSPDGERGRLGLLELRAFEMPPHPRMALVQALLVRTLVARFWRTPYRHPLVRWGTALHDRYLLPHWVAADAAEVASELVAEGYPFDPAWLDPFLEFRFPRLGSVEVHGVGVELRGAIEPWYTLGEEAAAGSTARYVDSSVERLQVKVSRLVPERFVVTANGVPLPLQPTGVPGEHVAGVRFRAWQPPSALHPTIPVQAPVVIDVVDRWNGRTLGGCRYHVTHPGGLAYETFPVNANEAEARRASRFQPFGSTDVGPVASRPPGPVAAGPGEPEYPGTLDLRRHHRPGA